jgi:hypothetical protein
MHVRRVTLIHVHRAPPQVVLQKCVLESMSRTNCWEECRIGSTEGERSGFKSTASVDRPCPNCVEPRLPRFWAIVSRIFSPLSQPQTEGYRCIRAARPQPLTIVPVQTRRLPCRRSALAPCNSPVALNQVAHPANRPRLRWLQLRPGQPIP